MQKQHWSRTSVIALLSIVLWFAATCPAHSDTTSSPAAEFELRAAVIIAILRFASQYDHEGTEYPVCLIGAPPSSEKLALGKGVAISKNRKLTVRTLPDDVPTASCAAIVMGPKLTTDQQSLIAAQAKENSNILICDDCVDDTLAHVVLRRKDERIVFAIDIALAQQSQISFSSKILSLAIETRPVRP